MNTWKGLGISFAHDYHEYDDNQLCQLRLQELWNAGLRRIRINMPPYTTETQNVALRDKLRVVITTALDMGFYVIWGYTKSQQPEVPTISAATWPTYSNAIQATASWAQSLPNGERFELSLGNEDDDKVDGTTLTSAQFRNNILSLATTCKGIFTKGKISYTSTIAFYNDWKALGKGDLDYYAVNIYASPSIFDIYAKVLKRDWGETGYIAEWNAADEGVNSFADEDSYNRELLRRYQLLRSNNITAYFFVYRSWGVAEKWALIKNDNTKRKSWYLLTDSRAQVYAADPKKNPGRNYIPNPSFDAGVSGWTTENGASFSRQTSGGGALTGAYATLSSTTSSSRVYTSPISGLRFLGKRCVLSFYARAGSSNKMYIEPVLNGVFNGYGDFTLTDGWVRYSMSFIISSSGVGGSVYFYPKERGTNTTGSVHISNVQLEFLEANLPPAAYPTDYMDGSGIFAGCRWDGTPNLSSTTRHTIPARLQATRSGGMVRAFSASRPAM